MDIRQELKDARERRDKIMEQVRALEQQKMLLLSEGLKIEGEIRLLEKMEKEH